MVGSDVDPFQKLGSTRLFVIEWSGESYRLSLAPDAQTTASTTTGISYPATDEGIREMYIALSQSAVFPGIRTCYVPGRLGGDLNALGKPGFASASYTPNLESGYDPATGLRTIVLGSAVSQVVPLDDFLKGRNEQIYDDAPAIVPLVSALVYDVTHYNKPGATTFVLPVYYARDQVTPGHFYVNRFATTSDVDGSPATYGQTAVFPNGPGYDDATATALKLQTTAVVKLGNRTFTTYTFDTAKVTTASVLQPKARLGVMSLTYASSSPSEVFAAQTIIGFYRDAGWVTSLGVPIYDFGSQNVTFSAAATALIAPTIVYDPAHPFLNGGSLQNVVQKLFQASYLYSIDRLQSILNVATTARDTESGAGLAVTTAMLDFQMSSTPGGAIADQLNTPVVASVTTTPSAVILPTPGNAVLRAEARMVDVARPAAAAVGRTISQSVATLNDLQTIGIGGNTPPSTQTAPSVFQAGLMAFIPREALDGTGITNVEIGTAFAEQSLGQGDAFEVQALGVVLNLMSGAKPAFAPIDLSIADSGAAFKPGISYVLSLTGTALTVRGSDGATASVTLHAGGDTAHTFVGAFVYGAGAKSMRLYPKLQLSLSAPAVGSNDILQGEKYSVRLTYGGTANSQLDVLDSSQALVASLSVASPSPSDRSTPQAGDYYFGSFIGGSSNVAVWSVPVFVTVRPADLAGASFDGTMTLDAQASGVPAYQLQITDSSLYVYSNIDVDISAVGTVSVRNVFLASATINSSPDDRTSRAFCPCRLFMGLVRQVQMGTTLRYAFVPSDDSVVIAGKRYMLSIIPLDLRDDNPNTRPYPPVFWPATKYWQFANRHNPYLDVHYTGATQDLRTARAEADSAKIGLATAEAREPIHMYLDTDERIVWPIFAFPVASAGQSIDRGQLSAITSAILNILKTEVPPTVQQSSGALDAERVTVPSALMQNNPYMVSLAAASDATQPVATEASGFVAASATESVMAGVQVKNLSTSLTTNLVVDSALAKESFRVLQAERGQATLAQMKSDTIATNVAQARTVESQGQSMQAAQGQFHPIYGFSVVNRGTGEAYIVEVINADLAIPDQLPQPTKNTTYNPYYVRVVFLNRLICYNMSIIVPSMAYDQYGHFATVKTPYANLLSKTNELTLGYMYSLYDSANNFDNLTFTPADIEAFRLAQSTSGRYLYTNLPYYTEQGASFSPLSLFSRFQSRSAFVGRKIGEFDNSMVSFAVPDAPPLYFLCRRLNWNADCHLMQATHEVGSSVFLAFGAGDIVPFRLDADFAVDKRFPAHMYKLTHTFADRQYDSAETISVANKPYVVAVATEGLSPKYVNFSINATAGTADLQIGNNTPLTFPTEIYVLGQASTTLTSIAAINTTLGSSLGSTGDFFTMDSSGNALVQEFQLVTYNSLVYLIRAVSNVPALGAVGGQATTSGLLIDTFVPTTTGTLALAQGARYKRSGLSFFGASYTPTTMVDSLDTLDFTSISGETFYASTIFIPIIELDATKGFVADLSSFLGQQIWTFIYPEIVAQAGDTVNGVTYPDGFNLDSGGNPTLSLQKLQFVYHPLVVLFTPNDLTHKYSLLPKQQVLALTNDQIREGICWRSANDQPQRLPPTNICAQQILPDGDGIDRPNIIYSSHNRAVRTPADPAYLGMAVSSFRSVAGIVYAIEELALTQKVDQTGAGFISQVSSNANMLVGVLFDYDNNDLGTLKNDDQSNATKGIVFLNGYLGAAGYAFSSPDHFDVNDVLPSQVPLLEQVTGAMGVNWDVAFYDADVSLPQQFWSLTYDSFTAPGLPNFIADVPPSPVDPTFSNRTRSLILSLQNPLHPTGLGLLDTYSSVVSANLHLANGVTGSVFLSKKADRDIANVGSNPADNPDQLYGLATEYDFFIFSRDHYWTLKEAKFELIDQGYAMCLVDDGTGTGTKVAQYYTDTGGKFYELYSYVLFSNSGGIIETNSFTLQVDLGSPGNSVDPTDMVAAINQVSDLIYAAFGPSQQGLPAAKIPIQAVGGGSGPHANPIVGAPGFNGYRLNVMTATRQPMFIAQLFVGDQGYGIAGSTTVVPLDGRTGQPQAFLGSLSHGLDRRGNVPLLQRSSPASFIPRATVPPGPTFGTYGGNGLGSLIGTPFSVAFQGSGAIPAAIAANTNPGTTMKADDRGFYTFNAVTGIAMDSNGDAVAATGGQYFIDSSDAANPIYGIVALPSFMLNGNTYAINLGTTLSGGTTSRYSLVIGGKSYLFGPDNAHVTVDRTKFTFNPLNAAVYTVTHSAIDDPAAEQAPAPIVLTPFSLTAGGQTAIVDVFNNPGGLANIVTGVLGRQYSYDPVHALVTVLQGAVSTTVKLQTGITFASTSGYGYVIGFSGGNYTVNGDPTYLYAASTTGKSASYALMTTPQMFTLDGNFYVFDRGPTGQYLSVSGNGQTLPINLFQFSILGQIYILNNGEQPHTVVGGGNVYPMTSNNTQFEIDGVQYTLVGRTVFGQFNLIQGNVVTVENYVYQLDTLNGQIVGNGTGYPLTTSGFTYTITTADRSFTVTAEPNATTVTIGNVDYLINNTTVVGDGITYPILPYRTFVDGATKFSIGFDGTASVAPPFTLSGSAPFTRSTFADGADTYTVNDVAAFDGTTYFRISGTPPQFTDGGTTYTLRNDGAVIAAGPAKTYIVDAGGPVNPKQFTFGSKTISFGRPQDLAAFDGSRYFAIVNNQFTDTDTGLTWTLSGNTAVNAGNSYEIFSNLGQGNYFQVPAGPTYYVNIDVADTGVATGDAFNVFPIATNQFAIPLAYTITIAGSVATVNAITFAAPMAVATLTAAGGSLIGGSFQDPVTKITYTCVIDAGQVAFVDSNNAIYPFPVPGALNAFIAMVQVTVRTNVAVDSALNLYPIDQGQFIAGSNTYTVNVPIAHENVAGPYFQMIDGRFVVPKAAPLSSIAYTVTGGRVVKGYVIDNDDEFSVDGNVVYTINQTTVVRATNQANLAGAVPNQTLTSEGQTYSLNSNTQIASYQPVGLSYNTATHKFTVSFSGVMVTYTVGVAAVKDDRNPQHIFLETVAGTQATFTDTFGGVTFTFDKSGNNPIIIQFAYQNQFFIDALRGVTYYVDVADDRVEAITYLPETTQYAFIPADGNIYLIHYSDVGVVFPVTAGADANAGIATVGADTFTLHIDEVDLEGDATAIPANTNSFEINGDLYTITGTPAGTDYSACHVVGTGMTPVPFLSVNTFKLTDPAITYTLHLDSVNLPQSVTASFAVKPSRNLISVDDNIYIVTYSTVSAGTLQGQGQSAIPISKSSFTLSNPFDSTMAKFVFADLNIYDAGSVVGQFTVNAVPTFFMANATYTLDPVNLVLTDSDKRLFPLLPNPTMFSINGFNYVIDSNRVPHGIIGNDNISPLATDVTVEAGHPIPNSTFTLNGQIYKYTEDAAHNLLTITGTRSYMIQQPALTFKLDSSLVFALHIGAPVAGNFPGTIVPIGTVAAGSLTLNVYAGTPESGGADFFMYKNVLYTFVKSGAAYEAVQKSYTVYAAHPLANQQQLAVFDFEGTTYIVTDGTTTGVGAPAGINPGTMWTRTATMATETQFGLVYGLDGQPTTITQSATGIFQFQAEDAAAASAIYDVLYAASSNTNEVKIDVPELLPSFTQVATFDFVTSAPLTFETGGYNAFTTFVEETATPVESFAGSYKTPIFSLDPKIDTLIGGQGDFSLEFWHSIPLGYPPPYHAAIYRASTSDGHLVYNLDVDFETDSDIYVTVNNTVMHGSTTPPVFSSRWRHVAISYAQPYTILCQGAGFEVKQASNFDFSRDFSISMTFAANDVTTRQGLLYKGTASDVTSPGLEMSYRASIAGGNVQLELTDSNGTVVGPFVGPSIEVKKYYQVIITKQTDTGSSTSDTDPSAPPFDLGELAPAAHDGGTATVKLPDAGSEDNASFKNIAPNTANTPKLKGLLDSVNSTASKSYSVSISVREVHDDGTFGSWVGGKLPSHTVSNDSEIALNPTGPAHLLIGAAYDDQGTALPLGSPANSGNIRDLYLFNSAIGTNGVKTTAGSVDIANASLEDLNKSGLVGYWKAQYDPNGVINNPVDPGAAAISTNTALAYLLALSGHEFEGTSLYVNGASIRLSLVPWSSAPASIFPYSAGTPVLLFYATGLYKLEEISLWRLARQPYQIVDDMFGRLVPTNEPSLALYLSGSFSAEGLLPPLLPMNQYIDRRPIDNAAALKLAFYPASYDLTGSPAIGRCGPLITPNLYTPPGMALTVCDQSPALSTYSVTLNSTTGTLAGEINEVYVYVKDHVLVLYAGKKVGDLVLSWVSQEQGDVQLIGYIEGAPPCPMANLTHGGSYDGATSTSFTVPTQVNLSYQKNGEHTHTTQLHLSGKAGVGFGIGLGAAPFGFGLHLKDAVVAVVLDAGGEHSSTQADGSGTQQAASGKIEEQKKYSVELGGAWLLTTGDNFMANINALSSSSNAPGAPNSKTAILPNPNLGGFTTSRPASPLPRAKPFEERYGERMFQPSPYGQAFVTSATLDVYQQTLVQSNTVYGFVKVPNTQIPRDINIVSFRMSSKYIRPGVLDGMIGYAYTPTMLPTGVETFGTSTGQMEPVYDKNFSSGEVGHDASYMRVVEAYRIKREIDQQTFNALAQYQTAYAAQGLPDDPALLPALDFYNEYVWSSKGATEEIKHSYSSTYQEAYTTNSSSTSANAFVFNAKITVAGVAVLDAGFDYHDTNTDVTKYTYSTGASTSFDISVSLSGIENDTQMRYASNNDAHFVMNFNSMYNQNNQSGLNLVIGSDGLVYNIVPSVTSGAGLPLSDNIDDTGNYMQPQPAYTNGNANGLSGALEPYDRPGKTTLFRTYAFFRQGAKQNDADFWETVVDPVWLANSPEADADALRTAKRGSLPWRLMYRVTYSERSLPPISTATVSVPQITPVMAVPVLDHVSDFLFEPVGQLPRPAKNPLNDIEANIVLAAPTAWGASAGSAGPTAGTTILPNNVIPFDLVMSAASVVNWGDSTNGKLLAKLLSTVLGLNTLQLSTIVPAGATKVADVMDPVKGGVLYTVYTDPNGLTLRVAVDASITVLQDVNGNPVQYFDGKSFHSLQADYVASSDGTVMIYVKPPSTYDQSAFDLTGDYDLFGHPGDEWRYFLVSGVSANMTAEPTVADIGPFRGAAGASPYTGFTIADAMHAGDGSLKVQGYVLVQGVLQWPHLNTAAESFADVQVYKAMSLLDTFPIGDPEVLISFLKAQYPQAPFATNDEINLVFTKNIVSNFNLSQQALLGQ